MIPLLTSLVCKDACQDTDPLVFSTLSPLLPPSRGLNPVTCEHEVTYAMDDTPNMVWCWDCGKSL